LARELERQIVALVQEVLDAEILPIPLWLIRPGREECGKQWPLVQRIYHDLSGLTLPDVMRSVERRQVDAVLVVSGEQPRILEVDEIQHFNEYRAVSLRRYMDDIPLAFPAEVWRRRSYEKRKLEGGGFAAPRSPLFPGAGGRHRQRAFRDALCDILPPEHGWLPTLRIADFEVRDWIAASDANERMSELLAGRLPRHRIRRRVE
jgi:hypothetical protein